MEIVFSQGVRGEALGRNGVMNTQGVLVAWLSKEVVLRPVTTKGTIGRCWLSIPLSELPKLVGALRRVLGESATKP